MSINIKPSKRGTFTAAAKKHGKSVQGFASQVLANKGNYSPAMVKKANFARNASKWKKAYGGEIGGEDPLIYGTAVPKSASYTHVPGVGNITVSHSQAQDRTGDLMVLSDATQRQRKMAEWEAKKRAAATPQQIAEAQARAAMNDAMGDNYRPGPAAPTRYTGAAAFVDPAVVAPPVVNSFVNKKTGYAKGGKMAPLYKYAEAGQLPVASPYRNLRPLYEYPDQDPFNAYNPAIPQNVQGGAASFGGFQGLAETAPGSGKYKKSPVAATSYDLPNLNIKAKGPRARGEQLGNGFLETGDTALVPGQLSVPDFGSGGLKTPPAGPAGQSWQSQVSQGLNNVAPFVSNIANSFRRPPSPAVPKSYNPVHLQRVNYGADKAEIDRQIAGQNAGLGQLGENQATAVRTANLIQGIRGKNQVSQAEANQNAQITNQEIGINSGIDQQNINQMNQYQDQKVNMRLAQQGQQAANLANAADKYVGIQNTRAQQRLEGDKFATLSKMYNQGVLDRADFQFDPKTGYKIRRFGGRMKYSAGGMMKVYANGGQPDPPVKVAPRIPVNMADPNAMINAAGNQYYPGSNVAVAQAMSPAATRSGDAMIKDPYTQALELDKLRQAETQARWRQMNPGVDPNMQVQQVRNTQGVVNPQTGDWMPTTYNRPGRVATPVGAVRAKYTKGGTMRKVYC